MSQAALDKLRRELGELIAQREARPDFYAELAARYGGDPVGFAADVLGVALWSKQQEILRLTLAERRTFAVSGNGVGKTVAAAVKVIHQLFCCGPSIVLTIAPGESQNLQLWNTIRDLVNTAGLPCEVRQQGLVIADRWFAMGRATTDPERLRGLHHERLLVVMDEAQGLRDWVFEAAGRLASGEQNTWLVIGNPGPLVGKWYDYCSAAGAAVVHISALDHPNVVEGREVIPGAVSRQAIADLVQDWGEDSAVYRIAVLGQFCDDVTDKLLTRELVLAAVARWEAKTLLVGAPPDLRAGLDVGRSNDLSSLCVTRNGHVLYLEAWRSGDLVEVAEHAGRVLTEHGVGSNGQHDGLTRHVDCVTQCDCLGHGAGVKDQLAAAGFDVREYYGPSGAYDRRQYGNVRAEAYHVLRERLKAGTVAIPNDELLIEELLAVHVQTDPSTGLRFLEDKRLLRSRLGRSPDRADSLVMSLYPADQWEADAGGGITIGGVVVTF